MASEGEAGKEVGVLAEASQDGSITKGRIGVDEVIGYGGAKGMASMDKFLEFSVDTLHRAFAKQC